MICATKQKTKNTDGFTVKCRDTTIKTTTKVKYLGVNLHNSLTGEGILDNIVKKCSGRIKFLYRQARSFPRSLKKTLPIFSSVTWTTLYPHGMLLTQTAKNKLQILQNKMIRFTLDLGPRTHITEEHMKELNMLRIPNRVKQLGLNTAHKIFYNKAPSYLNTQFKKTRDRAQSTRCSEWNFTVPKIKGAEGNTFYFNAIKDWNSLPEHLKACENTASFKQGVKRHLVQKAAQEADRDFLYF